MRLKLRPLHLVLGAGLLVQCLGPVLMVWVFLGPESLPSRTTPTDLTTNTDSDSIATSQERLAFVSRYFTLRAPATDASFRINFQDNSQGVPGPSDWNMAIVLRVSPSDRERWLKGATPGTPEDAAGPFSTQARRGIPSSWGVSSPGQIYRLGNAWLVWHPEGALEYSSTTSPF